MNKVTVKQLGIGSGKGDAVDILDRAEIENIITDLNPDDIFKMAYDNYSRGYLNGEAHLDLRTGKLTGGGYSQGSMDQACDSVYIILYRIDQNEELAVEGSCDCNEEFCDCVEHVTTDGYPISTNEMFPYDWKEQAEIEMQLDEWYADQNIIS